METIEAIKERRSIRKYVEKEIPKEILTDLIDCARLAPTGNNKQAWKFVVITDQGIRENIASEAQYGRFIKEAGACIAVLCDEEAATTPLQDASAATENILIAAKDYGLGSCWVNSYEEEHSQRVENMLQVPDKWKLMTLIAVGYQETSDNNVPKKDLDEVLVWNSFE